MIELLKDGHARSLEMLAIELGTSVEDIKRQLEYLENIHVVRRISLNVGGCSSCSGCSGGGGEQCKGCIPEGGFQNMGDMWEVI